MRVFVTLFCCFIINFSVFAQPSLTFSLVHDNPNDRIFKMGEKLLNEIGKRMKVDVRLLHLPAKRAEQLLKEGKIDADLSRVALYHKVASSAIKVPEPILSVPLYAYSATQSFKVAGWESLKKHKVVKVRGRVFFDNYLAEHNAYSVASHKMAFQFLQAKRADIFVCSRQIADIILDSPEFKANPPRRLEPAVINKFTHTYFAPHLVDEAKAFEQALIAIKAEGLYDKIFKET